MSNQRSVIYGKIYLKCKQCLELKEINSENWYKHREGFMGVLGRCKQCILDGRKTEKELSMFRIRDYNRFHYNEKRRKYIFSCSKLYSTPLKTECRKKATNKRRNLDLGNMCNVCNQKKTRIEMHHFDYNKPYDIILCCTICHRKLDMLKLDYKNYKITNLLNHL